MIRRLWTEAEPFDFDGDHVQLTGAFGNPKPVQRPHPPILIGGRAGPTLRVVAEHADLWNIPGGDIEDVIGPQRAARPLLRRDRPRPGRRSPARSTCPSSYDDPGSTRDGDRRGASRPASAHVVLGLSAPYPAGVARWVADEIVGRGTRP